MSSMQYYQEDIIAYAIMSVGRFQYAIMSAWTLLHNVIVSARTHLYSLCPPSCKTALGRLYFQFYIYQNTWRASPTSSDYTASLEEIFPYSNVFYFVLSYSQTHIKSYGVSADGICHTQPTQPFPKMFCVARVHNEAITSSVNIYS